MGAKVVSFINYKGGVGKTTTTYHIGCSLAQHHNKKVLLVDIDAQTNLTFLCAPFEKWQEFKRRTGTIATLYKKFLGRKTLDANRFIWHTPIQVGRGKIQNLDLIPCDVDLLGEDLGGGQLTGTFPTLESLRRQAKEYLRERMFLRNALREVSDKYDYILIDCPPNLYIMTQNALLASNWYIITAIPDHLSTIGLSILQDKVNKIGELTKAAQTFAGETEKPLKISKLGGVIFVKIRIGGSMITDTHFYKMAEVKKLVGEDLCFPIYTTELIGYGEAAANSVPVWILNTQNAERASHKMEYQQITNEFLRRF
jgi:chromosome partitioning protein